MNLDFGEPSGCNRSPRAQVSAAIGWLNQKKTINHHGHFFFLVGADPIGAEFAIQTLKAGYQVVMAPLADGHYRQTQQIGDDGVGLTGTACQHDLDTLHDRMGLGSRASKSLQLLKLVIVDNQRRHCTCKY